VRRQAMPGDFAKGVHQQESVAAGTTVIVPQCARTRQAAVPERLPVSPRTSVSSSWTAMRLTSSRVEDD
jgi:hypothetical protein